jgi:hypothetical protein
VAEAVQREFHENRASGSNTPLLYPAPSIDWNQIPFRIEQGIFSAEQGMVRREQGNGGNEQRIGAVYDVGVGPKRRS